MYLEERKERFQLSHDKTSIVRHIDFKDIKL